jgi:hypothetical protein
VGTTALFVLDEAVDVTLDVCCAALALLLGDEYNSRVKNASSSSP